MVQRYVGISLPSCAVPFGGLSDLVSGWGRTRSIPRFFPQDPQVDHQMGRMLGGEPILPVILVRTYVPASEVCRLRSSIDPIRQTGLVGDTTFGPGLTKSTRALYLLRE